jgi:hypothetical protein
MPQGPTKPLHADSDANPSSLSSAGDGSQPWAWVPPSGGENLAFQLSSLASSAGASPGDSPGQLFLMDDNGALTAVQSNSAKGGSSSTRVSTKTTVAAPAPTLVGTAGGFEINLVWDKSVASAPAGFESAVIAAAKYYTTLYSNAEVINIAVGYGEIAGSAMSAGALGESESYGYNLSYSTVASAMKKDASASNYTGQTNYVAQADASLPSADPTHGGYFFTTTAEAKALGLVSGGAPSSTTLDGYIGVTSSYPLEYNQTATTGTYDAIGIVEHEISEIMGRLGSEGALFGRNEYTPLDLFRYSKNGVRDLTPTAGYFSINNGATDLGNYNNPQYGGDASDWAAGLIGDSYGFGYAGHTALVSPTDILENAVLGYHLTSAGSTATQHLGLA